MRKASLSFLAFFFCLYTGPAQAELPGCAPDTMNVMINQAVLQTRQNDIANKTHIVKPDSILDYSCFRNVLKHTAEKAGPIFSETDFWAPRDIPNPNSPKGPVEVDFELGPSSLDLALAQTVTAIANPYLNSNFAHDYLGGTGGSPSRGTACGEMTQVWDAAKCANASEGDILLAKDLVGNDPRKFPKECPGGTGITQEMIDAKIKFSQPIDIYAVYMPEGKCGQPFITGVTTKRMYAPEDQGTEVSYAGATCLNGCIYSVDLAKARTAQSGSDKGTQGSATTGECKPMKEK